jgi:hypothetical protein
MMSPQNVLDSKRGCNIGHLKDARQILEFITLAKAICICLCYYLKDTWIITKRRRLILN